MKIAAASRMALPFLFAFVSLPGAAQTKKAPAPATPSHQIVRSAAMKWSAAELPGGQIAVVTGNPAEAGAAFVLRLKIGDGVKIPPHTHPGAEFVTVLKGTLLVAMGEKFDIAKAQTLNAGDFVRIEGNTPHFALAKGEVIMQIGGIGPFAIQWLNPADVKAPATPKKN